MNYRLFVWCAGIIGFLMSPSLARAGSGDPLPLQRITGPVAIDGLVNEPGWNEIRPLTLTQFDPINGGQPSERSEIRIAYDDHFLYASGRFYDSDPSGVRANSLYRDNWSGDDTFELILDTLNDNVNGAHFVTNPNGNRSDEIMFNDATGDNPFNLSWNTYWEASSARTAEGWSSEIRIPFSSLRFVNSGGRVVMGLTVNRFIVRKNEDDVFPPRDAKWERAVYRPSLTQNFLLEGVKDSNPVYVSPYALTGVGQVPRLDPDARSYEMQSDAPKEIGGDLKYNIKSDLTLDATVNTDFAQVESDDAQLNLTRSALFLPEKRQFFQERSGLFDFVTGNDGRLFYSRRIGIDPDGNPVRLYGGGRLIGRLGDWDVGLIDLQTGSSDTNSSENFGVLRFRHPVLNNASYAGGLFTSRIGADGRWNLAYGMDTSFRFFANDYLRFNLAQTSDAANTGSVSSGMVFAKWERPANVGVEYRAAWTYSGRDFDPEVGFTERKDFSLLDWRVGYGFKPGDSSRLFTHTPSVRQTAFFRNSDHSVESSETRAFWDFSYKSGYYWSIGTIASREDVRQEFSFSSHAHIPVGNYSFYGISGYFNSSYGPKVGFEVDTYAGGFYDGNRYAARMWPRWNLSRHLQLSGEYWYSHAVFPDRNEVFDSQIVRFHANAAINTRYTIATYLQYNGPASHAGVNIRFRYNPQEGNDIYLVYNQGVTTEHSSLIPEPPVTTDRTILLKYVHTFDL